MEDIKYPKQLDEYRSIGRRDLNCNSRDNWTDKIVRLKQVIIIIRRRRRRHEAEM